MNLTEQFWESFETKQFPKNPRRLTVQNNFNNRIFSKYSTTQALTTMDFTHPTLRSNAQATIQVGFKLISRKQHGRKRRHRSPGLEREINAVNRGRRDRRGEARVEVLTATVVDADWSRGRPGRGAGQKPKTRAWATAVGEAVTAGKRRGDVERSTRRGRADRVGVALTGAVDVAHDRGCGRSRGERRGTEYRVDRRATRAAR